MTLTTFIKKIIPTTTVFEKSLWKWPEGLSYALQVNCIGIFARSFKKVVIPDEFEKLFRKGLVGDHSAIAH